MLAAIGAFLDLMNSLNTNAGVDIVGMVGPLIGG